MLSFGGGEEVDGITWETAVD